jgi:hypothetical protein
MAVSTTKVCSGQHQRAVVYAAKDGNDRKVFAAKESLAAMCSHVPNHGEQMVWFSGWYSNVLRGKQQKNSVAELL